MTAPELAMSGSALSPIALFLHADLVGRGVMILLLVASVWTWGVILSSAVRLRGAAKASGTFERDFWKAEDVERFHDKHARSTIPSARVFSAGVEEWRRSTGGKSVDRVGTRERLAMAMGGAVGEQVDKLSDRLNILATVGSVAPFVGLFGTVWGIMRSFTDIAAQQNTSLGVVAPGIAEALFATALGLFAAIPAVIAYNRLGHSVGKLEARLNRFADDFHATLSRELEHGG